MKLIKRLLFVVVLVLVITGCSVFTVKSEKIEYLSGKYSVEMSIKKYGKIELELDADIAPITVTNFMNLVRNGSYDNTKIHRVDTDLGVVQGGQIDDAKTIKGEFLANGVDNSISHVRGVISMARSGGASSGYDSASSQFFITTKDATELDYYYAAFGKVTKGMDVLDKISKNAAGNGELGTITKESDKLIIEYIKEIEK